MRIHDQTYQDTACAVVTGRGCCVTVTCRKEFLSHRENQGRWAGVFNQYCRLKMLSAIVQGFQAARGGYTCRCFCCRQHCSHTTHSLVSRGTQRKYQVQYHRRRVMKPSTRAAATRNIKKN